MELPDNYQKMDNIFSLAENVISQQYLSLLADENYQLEKVTTKELGVGENPDKYCCLFHFHRLVYDVKEGFFDKLISVINVAYELKGTIVTTLKSDGAHVDYYIGVIAGNYVGEAKKSDREGLKSAFEGALRGNFNGSDMEMCENEDLMQFIDSIDGKAVCAVSVVPSLRREEHSSALEYVQGIENLADSLRGKKYTVLTIADPLSRDDLSERRRGYESVYTNLKPFQSVTQTQGSSHTVSLSSSEMENYVKGLTEGIATTQSNSTTTGRSKGINAGLSFIVSAGGSYSSNRSSTYTDGMTRSFANTEQMGHGRSRSTTVGQTDSDGIQIIRENRRVQTLLERIEKNLKRMDECEGLGAFMSATYVLAEDRETALCVAGNFISLMKGSRSSSQTSGISCWEGRSEIVDRLKLFLHPVFKINDEISVPSAMLVSGSELAVQLGLPKKSVNGISVLPMTPFGRNINGNISSPLKLGSLFYMGNKEEQKVAISRESLTSHTFITGSTGMGKSNAIYQIVGQLLEQKIPFLVIEPAKGEYKNVFGGRDDVNVYGTNPEITELLKLDPFAFPSGVHVLEHIDRLVEIFNVCWPMYAAMPAVLKDAVESAYISCGWDLERSKNHICENLYPNFSDLLSALQNVIARSAYDEEVKSNYEGSLVTRVRSLTNGINGQILNVRTGEESGIFDGNVIIDLSRVGSEETKAMLMGILVMKLQEVRMDSGRINAPLHHVTILEEAHHLLQKTSTEQYSESGNLMGKSVEMLSNAIAEMRTYGEGFIIADQSPGRLDASVIRNTNTKIILRTPEYSDRVLAGKAAGMSDGEIEEIARLPRGVAAIYQNDWLEPVLCSFEKYHYDEAYRYQKSSQPQIQDDREMQKNLVHWILNSRLSEESRFSMEKLKEIREMLNRVKISSVSRVQLMQILDLSLAQGKDMWKECPYKKTAGYVVEILGDERRYRYLLDHAESVSDINRDLEKGCDWLKDNAKLTDLQTEVEHCIMRCYSEDSPDALKKYYMWDFEMRNKLH